VNGGWQFLGRKDSETFCRFIASMTQGLALVRAHRADRASFPVPMTPIDLMMDEF
jgi:hypothetical protein